MIYYITKKTKTMVRIISIFIFLASSTFATAQKETMPEILSIEDQSRVIDDILEDRLDNLLPELMRREGVDMWVIISREYNEDPIMKTM